MLSTVQATQWLERWDRQQEAYMADREERFTVMADVLDAVVGRPDPLVIDLGAGPGSLSVRLLDRYPHAEVVAVDADPTLLGLARAAYGGRPGLRLVEADLRVDGWVARLGLDRVPDAIVSTTALHWLTRPELAALYTRCGALLTPGGVLIDGDHLFDGPALPGLEAVNRAVRQARADRVGLGEREDWAAWWDAVGRAEELTELVGDRSARPIDHSVADVPALHDHVELLTRAGFAEVGVVWQHGDDRVLVALR
jgi:SAM-dependent methyltransferase